MIVMPWTEETAPSLMLQITDSCNVRCRACYSPRSDIFRSLDDLASDLDRGRARRKLHTVTLTGGEPTLHPDIEAIVRTIKDRRLHCFLLTNGVTMDASLMQRLKRAGLDSVLFHVDTGQSRSDLPDPPSINDCQKRLGELLALAAEHKVDASQSWTIYPEQDGQWRDVISLFLNDPTMSFLFMSRAIQADSLEPDRNGGPSPFGLMPHLKGEVRDFLRERSIEPFAYIPAVTRDGRKTDETCWLSWFVPQIRRAGELSGAYRFRSTWIDRLFMFLPKWISGRHIHKSSQNGFVTGLRVAINALSSAQPLHGARFLLRSLKPGSKLRHKMIVYDDGPFITQENEIAFCEYCPTAVVRNDKLVRCCLLKEAAE
jgi:hypothetical protein